MEDKYRKRLLRQTLSAERSRLSPREAEEKSRAVFVRIREMPEYRDAQMILCYMDFRGEVATRGFIQTCLSEGKQIALPRLVQDPGARYRHMEIRRIDELSQSLAPGAWGILEPDPAVSNRVKASDIELAVIPGVAFDLRRYRLGYGMGYFDAYFAQTRGHYLKVGVCFDLQVIDRIPIENHDVRMDRVVTENRVIV